MTHLRNALGKNLTEPRLPRPAVPGALVVVAGGMGQGSALDAAVAGAGMDTAAATVARWLWARPDR
ncbi:hypothetical protein [Actinokineospora fastidiosa]|uniref:Uncharacterized protein n=1 Tax=Actinokineospora fastidiosa TaxID=1816 RepID=A0A918LJJ8_9PSEU|nr:hypothetical protein [Actinokineospora fastidiosa]GGS56905.1 hypothetical protein GCM10010171_59940 [Actinokineospora fastidiosa]